MRFDRRFLIAKACRIKKIFIFIDGKASVETRKEKLCAFLGFEIIHYFQFEYKEKANLTF